LNLRQP